MILSEIFNKLLKENKQYDKFWKQHGIKPESGSIGFSEKEQKWYGWSHRAICGFGVGDEIKEGDCAASSGYVDSYIKGHPESDSSLPVGFKAKTLDDAKKMAIAFQKSVS